MLSIARDISIQTQRIRLQVIKNQLRSFSQDKSERIKALDYPKIKQIAHNSLVGFIPGFDEIAPKSCSTIVILAEFKRFLIETNPVQIPQGCLFSVIRCIDQWNGRPSLLDKPGIKDVLSGQKSLDQATFDDFEEMAFIKSHLKKTSELSEEQQHMTPTDKRFITKFVKHSILTDLYISAKELETHFSATKQPIYSMLRWEEGGYQVHAIPVFGVDTNDHIHFWDVSDKLDKNSKRLQTMHIEEFNDRRNLPPEYVGIIKGVMSRSQIYFLNKEEK